MGIFSVVLFATLAAFGASAPLVVMMLCVHEEKHRRCGDEDYVEDPEPVLGDGEGHVVTHLLATRLEGVAGKLLLLVLKQVTGHGPENQDPKHEHEQQPEAAEHRRVGLKAVEKPAKEAPFPHDWGAAPTSARTPSDLKRN